MIQFTKPLFLLLLPPLAWYAWRLARHSLADMSRFRSRLALGLRLTILTLLVFALAGARVVRNASQQCVVFALDASDSISKTKQNAALAYVNRALKTMKSDQKAAMVVFGGDASVELAPSSTSKIDRIYSTTDTSNTDVSQALGLALATFPEQCAKKIVLLSDGNETSGRALEQAALAGANDISIDTVPLTSELPKEVLLDKMTCPSTVKIGEPFDLKITAVSKRPTVATIRLLRNGLPAGERALDLPSGKSVCTFRQSIAQPGGFEFKAIVESADDTRMQNNTALADTKVVGKPRVLYCEGKPGQAKYLSSALSSSDIVVDTRDRSGIPTTMAQLGNYDMLVLSDVPAMSMSADQMLMIKSAVKDLGIGFTMVGGEDSFGAGGYYDTPIEQTLPVDMSVRKTKVLPTLTVVIVMDKSGSMGMPEGGRTKIELANDAAASVVKLLQPVDYVLGHRLPHRAGRGGAAVQGRQQGADLQRDFDHPRGGRRDLRVPVDEDGVGRDLQQPDAAETRHSARGRRGLRRAGGRNPHRQNDGFQKDHRDHRRHRRGQGRAVPQGDRLRRQGLLLPRSARPGPQGHLHQGRHDGLEVADRRGAVQRRAWTPPRRSWPGSIRARCRPCWATSQRARSPLRAFWRPHTATTRSLLRGNTDSAASAAFTSDCKARWATRWLTWPDYNKFWAQVLRSTMRRSGPRDFQTTVDVESGVAHVVVDAVDEKGNFLNFLKFAGSVVPPDLNAHSVSIEQTGPGRYEGTFDARQVGSYVVNVVSKGKGQQSSDMNVISIPYPPEYKDLAPNTALLKRIATQTSGRFDPTADSLFSGNFRRSKTYSDIWQLLALIALLMLPVDVAVRRVAVSPQQAAEILGRGLGPRAVMGCRAKAAPQNAGALRDNDHAPRREEGRVEAERA